MRTASDQRTRCAVQAAPGPDVVPHRGATAACFVDGEQARAELRAAARAARLRRAGVAAAAALAASSGADSAARGEGQEERAPWKDHEFCNPLLEGVWTRAGSRRTKSDKRRVSYALRDALRSISVKRVADCGRRRIAAQVEVVRRPFVDPEGQLGYRAHYRGILRCGSGWECPVCGCQIRAERSRQVEQAVEVWGLDRVAMMSNTVRHGLGHDLRTVRRGETLAYSRFTRGEPWKRFKARYGVRHTIRALEVTHGRNGWHPHLHVQLFLDRPLSEEELASAKAWLGERWARCVARELGAEHVPDAVHGVDLRPSRRGDYGFKIALEMADHGTKRARRGYRTPWQIAADYAAHGTDTDACLWRNYCAGMRGAKMHEWSKGLREAVGVASEKAEQEIVDGEQMPEDEPVAVLEPSAWLLISSAGTAAVLAILEAAENAGTATEADRAIRRVLREQGRGS